jgi:hypothetical protein
LIQRHLTESRAWQNWSNLLVRAMENSGFKTLREIQYSGFAVDYSFVPVSAFEKQ